MIEISRSEAVTQLLRKIERAPHLFSEVAISSPFIDGYGAEILGRLAGLRSARYLLRVVTRPEAEGLLAHLVKPDGRLALRLSPNLHAKAYGALGWNWTENEAFVGSPNLTEAGLLRNIELGIRIRGTTPEMASLAERVVGWTRRTAELQPGPQTAGGRR